MAQAFLHTPFITPAEQDRIVSAWFIRQRHHWCMRALRDLIYRDPETAWAIVVRLVLEAPDNSILLNVAGGPLEELLTRHGARLVRRAEQLARVSREFQYALKNVWLPDSHSSVTRRLETLGCHRLVLTESERQLLS